MDTKYLSIKNNSLLWSLNITRYAQLSPTIKLLENSERCLSNNIGTSSQLLKIKRIWITNITNEKTVIKSKNMSNVTKI